MFEANRDFYPTPRATIEKMFAGIDINRLSEFLDVGAGSGYISDFIRGHFTDYGRKPNLDVIETDADLQSILRDKKYRLVHDDFLTFRTRKYYDLIVGNFPFSQGDAFLAHALQMLDRTGGALRCLVNAETLRNPFSELRRQVVARLDRIGAEIEFLPGEFAAAERRTCVEVALVKARVEKTNDFSIILDGLQKARRADEERAAPAAPNKLVERSFISQLVADFEMEVEFGARLIEEYHAGTPLIRNRVLRDGETDYSSPLIKLEVNGSSYGNAARQINDYLEGMRRKYWSLLVSDRRFTSQFTSNIVKELDQKLNELVGYDFNLFNIRALCNDLLEKVSRGVEDSILKIFDDFSRQFSHYPECQNNTWFVSGWRTNKAHKINDKKVIIPMNGFAAYSSRKRLDDSYMQEKLGDLVKVFNYLAGEQTDARRLVGERVEAANSTENFSNIDLRYFDVTFYKKGTCHIRFKDKSLVEKLNIYGSRKKGWLPPCYGKKRYAEMDAEEKAVIDDFQGAAVYEQVFANAEFFLVEPRLPQLAAAFA